MAAITFSLDHELMVTWKKFCKKIGKDVSDELRYLMIIRMEVGDDIEKLETQKKEILKTRIIKDLNPEVFTE